MSSTLIPCFLCFIYSLSWSSLADSSNPLSSESSHHSLGIEMSAFDYWGFAKTICVHVEYMHWQRVKSYSLSFGFIFLFSSRTLIWELISVKRHPAEQSSVKKTFTGVVRSCSFSRLLKKRPRGSTIQHPHALLRMCVTLNALHQGNMGSI